VPIDYQKLMQWPFPALSRRYTRDDSIRFAKGFGAGVGEGMGPDDVPFLAGSAALPMNAVALADGEFWQMRPETGIQWRQIVHAEESIVIHRPLSPEGVVVVTQNVDEIFDRGADRGAVMVQKQVLSSEEGIALVTISVTTILKGDGGFGGKPYVPLKVPVPEDRAPDATIEIRTPRDDGDAVFRLSKEIAAASSVGAGKSMMRGVGCFGIAGRGILKLVCGNDPVRLKKLMVRYVGPMFTDETMLIELWHLASGGAVFRMSAQERGALVLNNCVVEFEA
jgi:hypothetical protein